jgi:hypothetical protein
MRENYILILVLALLAILPSLIFTLLSGLAFRQNWAFWYYSFSFASFCGTFFLILFVLWFFYMPRPHGMQEGMGLILLPFLGLVFGIGAFLLGLLTYPFWDFKDAFWTATPLPSYPFWVSVASIVGFELIWLLSVF